MTFPAKMQLKIFSLLGSQKSRLYLQRIDNITDLMEHMRHCTLCDRSVKVYQIDY